MMYGNGMEQKEIYRMDTTEQRVETKNITLLYFKELHCKSESMAVLLHNWARRPRNRAQLGRRVMVLLHFDSDYNSSRNDTQD